MILGFIFVLVFAFVFQTKAVKLQKERINDAKQRIGDLMIIDIKLNTFVNDCYSCNRKMQKDSILVNLILKVGGQN